MSTKFNRIVDAVERVGKRFDSMCSRKDAADKIELEKRQKQIMSEGVSSSDIAKQMAREQLEKETKR